MLTASTGRNQRVVLFGGQGFHYPRMGSVFWLEHPEFQFWIRQFSQWTQEDRGLDLLDFLYGKDSEEERFQSKLSWTHPANFAFNFSVAKVLEVEGITPDILMGYSQGELVALTLAGGVEVREAFRFVNDTAAILEGRVLDGGMVAVVGSSSLMSRFSKEFEGLSLACVNHGEHFVVAGTDGRLEALIRNLKLSGILSVRLPVACPFHCPLMEPAAIAYRKRAEHLAWSSLRHPVFSIHLQRFVTASDLQAEFAWGVVRGMVGFQEAIKLWEREGRCCYIDASPSGTLHSFLGRLLPRDGGSRVYPLATAYRRDMINLARLKEALN